MPLEAKTDGAKGMLVADDAKVTEAQPGRSSAEMVREAADLYRGLPPEARVNIVEESSNRLIVDYDFASMGARIAPKADPSKSLSEVPVRWVMDVRDLGDGRCEVRNRMFYLGDDPAMGRAMKDGYARSPSK
ncbi:MAG: hypothetical protein AMXMBFR58_13100 [Phycisphaerae bacterium]